MVPGVNGEKALLSFSLENCVERGKTGYYFRNQLRKTTLPIDVSCKDRWDVNIVRQDNFVPICPDSEVPTDLLLTPFVTNFSVNLILFTWVEAWAEFRTDFEKDAAILLNKPLVLICLIISTLYLTYLIDIEDTL